LGRDHGMLIANNFSYGLLTPVLGYLMSCLGAFIGLRCATRAYAYTGATRARWLVLAAISIGATGIWVMHFIAMLGYTIPGMTIRYNIAITIGSMLVAVAVVLVGLLIAGFGRRTTLSLLLAGLITGVGIAMPSGGATAESFLLPLIIGIAAVSIIMSAPLVFSPTEAEIREGRALIERINAATARLASGSPLPPIQAVPSARWPGMPGSVRTAPPGQNDVTVAREATSGYAQTGHYDATSSPGQYGQEGHNDRRAGNELPVRNDLPVRNKTPQGQ
jgi:hypothetical protein